VDEPRQHFLAGAGLADDEHRAIGDRHAAGKIQDQSRRRIDGDRLHGIS
jgi:hypothetical protein